MNAGYLSGLGLPFGGSPTLLRCPEEGQGNLSAVPQAPKAKAKQEAKPRQDVKSKPEAAQAPAPATAEEDASDGRSFLEKWIDTELAKGGRCHGQKVLTRFPPEPNGYLHIGHAKSITVNFGLAQKYGGGCNLRFDDTNPDTEETEYVESIQEDVCWVCQGLDMEKCKNGGKPWVGEPLYASDYFQQMYDFAIDLIKQGKAYVDSQTPEEVQKNRGGGPNNLPGVDSPFRKRSAEENLKLFEEMQAGKHPEGSLLLRAKIDMNHPNMNMRDPPMYRIRFSSHHRTGDRWKVYPIYDFAHGNEDAIEGVTHSICTLEFENHRALYDWFLALVQAVPSLARDGWEFAVGASASSPASGTQQAATPGSSSPVLFLAKGVPCHQGGPPTPYVAVPPVAGTPRDLTARVLCIPVLRRPGVSPVEEDLQISVDDAALSCLTQIQANELAFAAVRADNSVITWGVVAPGPVQEVGVSDRNSVTPWDLVEECWREDLEPISKRRLAVLDPLEVELIDYDKEELIEGITDLPDQSATSDPSCARTLSFSKRVYIDRSDYQENPPEGYFRLGKIGSEVKLRYSYVIKLEEVVKDSAGKVVKLKCSHDPATRDIMPDRKPKVIHWVNAKDCLDAEVRLINPLFLPIPDPLPEGKDWVEYMNPEAWIQCAAKVEPALGRCTLEDRFQFERCGYFAPDYDCFGNTPKLTFNRVVPLKESSDKKKLDGSEFSAYDEAGLPTHDKDGNALPKSAVKKLAKDLEKQKKLHESWKASQKS
ncbi:glnS [Symbiodinium pilosum]|uniref:GlnS protein n=1 Tax=Symbiodinium pilosum TaxID=2952 RepID=A0A812IZZ4_SYMPI|nr:glnS [Symbiodinium pilosum]